VPPGEYDRYVISKQKLCTLDAKNMYCNCMPEMHTAGIWDPILDNYQFSYLQQKFRYFKMSIRTSIVQWYQTSAAKQTQLYITHCTNIFFKIIIIYIINMQHLTHHVSVIRMTNRIMSFLS